MTPKLGDQYLTTGNSYPLYARYRNPAVAFRQSALLLTCTGAYLARKLATAKTPTAAQKKYIVFSEYTWSASYLHPLENRFRKQ